jgi:hypothetical protein
MIPRGTNGIYFGYASIIVTSDSPRFTFVIVITAPSSTHPLADQKGLVYVHVYATACQTDRPAEQHITPAMRKWQ